MKVDGPLDVVDLQAINKSARLLSLPDWQQTSGLIFSVIGIVVGDPMASFNVERKNVVTKLYMRVHVGSSNVNTSFTSWGTDIIQRSYSVNSPFPTPALQQRSLLTISDSAGTLSVDTKVPTISVSVVTVSKFSKHSLLWCQYKALLKKNTTPLLQSH